MTIEEAKHKLDFMKKAYQKLIDEKVDSGKLVGDGVSGEWKTETPLDEAYKSMIDALEMAIKALEQEPCEDAVSRRAVNEIINDAYYLKIDDGAALQESIHQLPSVTPQPKMGRWVKTIGENGVTSAVRCSECGFEDNRYELFDYCPVCGAKMQEVEE